MLVMSIIGWMNISAVNLNLLVALQALIEERSVTRAARRVGVSQPAMSNNLAQLRLLFNDPLFRRTSHGLQATPRALEVAEPLRQGLRLLETSLAARSFDAATTTRRFVIAASDYVEFVLLAPLIERLEREAPGVELQIRPWGLHEVPEMLARAEADLMIGFFEGCPAHHHAQKLFDEEYVCIVRKGHPTVRTRLTLSRYLELGHVLVSQKPDSPGSVDVALAAKGQRRRVAARVSHFTMVPTLIARTDLVAALSRRVAEPAALWLGLRVLPPPVALPRGTIRQVWHEQMNADPGHRWFRELVKDVSSAL
jgi:DNA-binding transcriptional LysR family regulator